MNTETISESESDGYPRVYRAVNGSGKLTIQVVYRNRVETYNISDNYSLSQLNKDSEEAGHNFRCMGQVYDDEWYTNNGYQKIAASKTVLKIVKEKEVSK